MTLPSAVRARLRLETGDRLLVTVQDDDTNLLARLLTNDDLRRAAKVDAWMGENATAKAPAYVDHLVLCELAWVLERSYEYARGEIHQALTALMSQDRPACPTGWSASARAVPLTPK